ncbi:DNA-binding protein [Bimuria novae-zelandiae CBS 107.79]|uniref:DNA-binding protein n=1 Tax=Bimuria novae-zelandiae CBS 107.79 TaxID=1447943 RepID=A0A6A5UPQ2_9PLEO|nr:DNA-binding protein [Bimuria novae-zelandiae CBS 107.79]
MPTTYLTTLMAFTHFLTAYIHTLLYLRHLYPHESFLRTRFHNTPVHQSRHPNVCQWILDAVAAVKEELTKGTVARIAIVIFHPGITPSSSYEEEEGLGQVKILERYMLDVSSFPVLTREERFMDIEWQKTEAEREAERARQAEEDARIAAALAAQEESAFKGKGKAKKKEKKAPLDAEVAVDLSEQFRAAFITLSTRVSQLEQLPEGCSFNISMELKDEADVDPPIGHPQKWMPSQPSLQKTGRKGATVQDNGRQEGEDLGGAKVTPIRTVEAGVFRFETWIEEGKAKFNTRWPKSSFESSAG